MSDRVNVLCMKCGGDILMPPALCGNCASAIPPRDPTEAMLAAPWRKMIENYPTWQPTDVERSNMRYGWIAMYDAAIAEKEGK